MKLRKNINKPLVFTLMIILSITLAFGILGYIYFLYPKLSEFKIIGVVEEGKNLILKVENSYNAVSYNVTGYDKDENIIYEKESNNKDIDITDLIMEHNEEINFEVTVKNKKNETLKAKKSLKYKNENASFFKIKDHFLNEYEDIKLITTVGTNELYKVKLFYKGSEVYDTTVKGNSVTISHNEIASFEGRITAKLYNEHNRVVSVYNFYLNAPIVGNFNIISPQDNFETRWDDINVYYTGGENATNLIVRIYGKKNKLINQIKTSFKTNNIILPAEIFKENENYKIEIIASYLDYEEISKKDIINVSIKQKETTSPVFVSNNYTFIKPGTKVELLTSTESAQIYYTLDGTKPNENSLKYSEPISINSDVTIKTYAQKNNMYDSEINEYNFKIGTKTPVVYLSPSNQFSNKGVKEVGYTNERDMMNKLTDYLENYLKNAGVTVYRNKSSGNINAWLAESNTKKSDFHFAIHSNGSANHDTKGMEIYVDKPTSKCLSIASNIYRNLYEIYPYRDSLTDRGVKYANGSLGEANDSFIKCGALIEVAYHDDYDDAKWIMDNMESIANNIANSISKFYQINE